MTVTGWITGVLFAFVGSALCSVLERFASPATDDGKPEHVDEVQR